MNMNDIAWAAGLFEGEGCISSTLNNGKMRWSLELGSTDPDVVDKFHRTVEVGRVWSEHPTTPSGKPAKELFRWRCNRMADILVVLTLLQQWFGERRKAKAAEAVQSISAMLANLSPVSPQRASKTGRRFDF